MQLDELAQVLWKSVCPVVCRQFLETEHPVVTSIKNPELALARSSLTHTLCVGVFPCAWCSQVSRECQCVVLLAAAAIVRVAVLWCQTE